MNTQNIFIMFVASFGVCFALQAYPMIQEDDNTSNLDASDYYDTSNLDESDYYDTSNLDESDFTWIRVGCLEVYYVPVVYTEEDTPNKKNIHIKYIRKYNCSTSPEGNHQDNKK